MSSAEPAPAPGDRFGGYLLIQEIGRGGMGIVYKARQQAVDRLVALKILRNRKSGSGEVERFTNEARSIARLVHPGIVRIHDVGQVGNWHYLACELIVGTSLDQIIDGQPMAPDRALEIVALLAEAIDYAHQKGVIHRDLKPSNVLLDARGIPHLTDFGLARRLDVDSLRLTQTGEVLGTPAYMSPEQVNHELGPIAATTDVHGLGTILYELLTGHPPFSGDSMLNTLHQVLYELPLAPHTVCPDVPASHGELCLKCLAKQPADRHPTARAVAIHCRGLLAGLVPTPPSTLTQLPAFVPTPERDPAPADPSGPPPAVAPDPPPAGPSLLRPLLLIAGLSAAGLMGYLIKTPGESSPSTGPPPSERPAPPALDLMPAYIRAIERGDQAAAFAVLAQHLAQRPTDWNMRSKRIDLARQLNRTAEVISDLQALEAADKLSYLEAQTLMEVYLKLGQQEQAVALERLVLRRYPELASRMALEQASQLLSAGRPLQAARAWLRTNPRDAEDPMFLGSLEQALRGKLTDEPRLMQDLARRDPRFFQWPKLADFAADLRRVESLSAKLLERLLLETASDRKWDAVGHTAAKALIAQDQRRADRLNTRAETLGSAACQDHRNREAVRQNTIRLALNPGSAPLLSHRGTHYWNQGKLDLALADYDAALRLAPKSRTVLGYRALALFEDGKYLKSIDDYTAMIAIKPKKKHRHEGEALHQVLAQRGFTYLILDRPKPARADLARAAKLSPSLVYTLGLALANPGTQRAALRKLLSRGAGQILASYVHRFVRSGLFVKVATRLIARLPNHPLAHAERGYLQLDRYKRVEAIRDLERALQLSTGEHATRRPAIKQALKKARALPAEKN